MALGNELLTTLFSVLNVSSSYFCCLPVIYCNNLFNCFPQFLSIYFYISYRFAQLLLSFFKEFFTK